MTRQTKWYGWRRQLGDFRDHRHATQPVVLPSRGGIEIRSVPRVRDQGAQGSCVGHGVRSVGQYVRKYTGQPDHELSPRFVYWNGRVIEGTTREDSGLEIRDGIKGAADKGFASEHNCPYNPGNFTTAPTRTAFRYALRDVPINYALVEQSKSGICGALNDKFAIAFGFTVYQNFEDDVVSRTGLMPMPQGQVAGGHCVYAGWFDDNIKIHGETGGVLCGNSWGTDWGCAGPTGERGYFWMPYNYILSGDLASDFWLIRTIS